jgi:hypothetical protein
MLPDTFPSVVDSARIRLDDIVVLAAEGFYT